MWAVTIPAGGEFMHCDSSQRNWTVSCCPGCHCPLEKELFWCLHRDIKLQQSMSTNESPVLGVGGITSPKDGLETQCLAWWTLEQTHCMRWSSSFIPSWIPLVWGIRGGNSFQADYVCYSTLTGSEMSSVQPQIPSHWWTPSLPSNWMTLP